MGMITGMGTEAQAPKTKRQAPKKSQNAESSKTGLELSRFCRLKLFWSLELVLWSFRRVAGTLAGFVP
jgi:hypothetical protein